MCFPLGSSNRGLQPVLVIARQESQAEDDWDRPLDCTGRPCSSTRTVSVIQLFSTKIDMGSMTPCAFLAASISGEVIAFFIAARS